MPSNTSMGSWYGSGLMRSMAAMASSMVYRGVAFSLPARIALRDFHEVSTSWMCAESFNMISHSFAVGIEV